MPGEGGRCRSSRSCATGCSSPRTRSREGLDSIVEEAVATGSGRRSRRADAVPMPRPRRRRRRPASWAGCWARDEVAAPRAGRCDAGKPGGAADPGRHGRGYGAAGDGQHRRGADGRRVSAEEIKEALAAEIARIMEPVARPMPLYPKKPQVVLVVGVNGSGKTTTIGKLASQFKAAGKIGGDRRGRHVPRGGGGAVADLGQRARACRC